MRIKGEDADNIALGDTFTKDAHARDEQGQKRSFDYMLANPPFGVEWKQQQRYIEHERDTLGYQGRFGAGTPRINDGALLFLQHMIDKMRPASEGGKAVVSALSERDETAEICRNRDGEGEPDAELRDTENVPLKESIQAYFEREVLHHVPDAWIDHSKTKIGYEIPLNRHFYRYEPPRDLALIEAEIKALEADIVRLQGEVTA
mgnify:CR=1 FL=1